MYRDAPCALALAGHGRTPEQCRHRWEHVLSEGLVKGAFTEDEDEIIVQAMKEGKHLSWMQIAARIPHPLHFAVVAAEPICFKIWRAVGPCGTPMFRSAMKGGISQWIELMT